MVQESNYDSNVISRDREKIWVLTEVAHQPVNMKYSVVKLHNVPNFAHNSTIPIKTKLSIKSVFDPVVSAARRASSLLAQLAELFV